MVIALERVVDSLYPEEKRKLKLVPLEKQTKDSQQKEGKNTTFLETIESGEELADDKEEKKEEELKIEYGLPEEILAGALYNSISVHYTLSGFYQEQKPSYAANDDEVEKKPQGWIFDRQEAETMTQEEAEKAIADVQYAAASGSYGDVDSRTRQRLALTALFDPSAFWLTERLGRITTDVDYSRKV